MMELTIDEKQIIVLALQQHLEEVKKAENLGDQSFGMFASEVKYDDIVQAIIDKLRH
jgi:hypothetical protein